MINNEQYNYSVCPDNSSHQGNCHISSITSTLPRRGLPWPTLNGNVCTHTNLAIFINLQKYMAYFHNIRALNTNDNDDDDDDDNDNDSILQISILCFAEACRARRCRPSTNNTIVILME